MPTVEVSEKTFRFLEKDAAEYGMAANAYLEKLVYEAWVRAEVQKGLDDVAAGRVEEHHGMDEIIAEAEAEYKKMNEDA